jgi:ribosomal protein S18 acetylase RimI-like enzyme
VHVWLDGTLASMTPPEVSISDAPLSKGELQDAAVVASRAFYDDPFFVHLSPGPLLRARGLAIYLNATCRHLGPKGQLHTARRDGRIVGVAGWIAPGGYPYPAADQALQLVGALRALAPRPPALVEGLRYLTAIEKVHPKEPLWYLQLLACDPAHQRQGIGTLLQENVLATCDRKGLGAYLETQNEDNLAYYRRFGYEVVDVLRPVRTGPPLWTMRREPRPAGG